jgi:hypothetical protein
MIFHVVFSPMILAMQLKVTSVPSGKLESDNKNGAYLQAGTLTIKNVDHLINIRNFN